MSGNHSRMKGYRTLDWLPAYAVSEDGDVIRVVDGKTRKAGHVLTPIKVGGYIKYKLTLPSGEKKMIAAHRLVCEAFHGPAKAPFYQVAHYDGVRDNNHFTNLRWTTCIQNHWDKRRHQTDASGERNGRAVLTREQVAVIRAGLTGKHGEVARLAREYGVSHSAMLDVARGRHWK